jgi:hypothetical protein
MARLCERTEGSVVGVKRVPREEVSAYGVIDPVGEDDADGVVAVRDVVEKPPVQDAPSDLIIIGRYVLTPDVFDDIAASASRRGRRAAAHRCAERPGVTGPFHGWCPTSRRHDTGTPLGWLARWSSWGSSTRITGRTSPPGWSRWLDPPVAALSRHHDETVLVDDEAGLGLARVHRRGAQAPRSTPGRRAGVTHGWATTRACRRRPGHGDQRPVTHLEWEAAHQQGVGERGAGQAHVGAAVEVHPVRAVDLSPASGAVGGQPQVGLVEVPEQQHLADLERRRQPQDVVHPLPAHVALGRPGLVLPPQGERLDHSPSHVLQVTAQPSLENGG